MANNDRVSDRYFRRVDSRRSQDACRERIHWICRNCVGQRVLDIGCSQGIASIILGREGVDVLGIDLEEAAIADARAALSAEPDYVREHVRFAVQNAFVADVAPGSFDTVILGEVLEHLVKPDELLERASCWLRDGGRLIVTVPLGLHPYHDHKRSFYLDGLLRLLTPRYSVEDVAVINDLYLGARADKPLAGASPEAPDRERLSRWNLAFERAIEKAQSREYYRRLDSEARFKSREAKLERQAARLTAQRNARTGRLLEARRQNAALREELDAARARFLRTGRSTAPELNGQLPMAGDGTGGFLFFCVNGAGLGHVTRSLAIARRIARIDPQMPIYFLSSSQALQAISREGMIAYHIPPAAKLKHRLPPEQWNRLLHDQLRLIVSAHRPGVLVYDGVFPYAGLMKALCECKFAYSAMVLRLRHKHNRLARYMDKLDAFDRVFFPGEPGIAVPEGFGALPHELTAPVIMLDRTELLPRAEVRRRWGIPEDARVAYIQLGAGNIDSCDDWLIAVLEALADRPGVVPIVATSPISEDPPRLPPTVKTLTHYPNPLYFNGIDIAVAAAGYNTFHELMHFGVPSVFIPNQETMTDDQVARAATAQEAGAARVVLNRDELADALDCTLDRHRAAAMREAAIQLVSNNGAATIARHLVEMACDRLARVGLSETATA